jgi:protein SCO1
MSASEDLGRAFQRRVRTRRRIAWARLGLVVAIGLWRLQAPAASGPFPDIQGQGTRAFRAKGVVKEIEVDGRTVVVAHEAVAGYMQAMTMPFNVKEKAELAGLRAGDQISFRLQVSETESWIDQILRTGTVSNQPSLAGPGVRAVRRRHLLMDYKFTNELDQAVSLGDFHGQALAITFFFTRCPVPDFCPRLSKNFQEASQKLLALTNAPANWHFLSFSFDTDFDTPAVMKTYAERYGYDPRHWSFVTGPAEIIAELAAESDAKFERDGSFFNHNFRTLIIDAGGRLQMAFPIGGNFSDEIVSEILKAAAATNGPAR